MEDSGIAKLIVIDALNKKKNVVTANKALVSRYWNDFQKLTTINNCKIKFEAAVAGGIPIIKVIDEFLLSIKSKEFMEY